MIRKRNRGMTLKREERIKKKRNIERDYRKRGIYIYKKNIVIVIVRKVGDRTGKKRNIERNDNKEKRENWLKKER